MPRKPNYNFEKRQKELDRQMRKQAKLAEREQRRELATSQEQSDAAEPQTPPDADP